MAKTFSSNPNKRRWYFPMTREKIRRRDLAVPPLRLGRSCRVFVSTISGFLTVLRILRIAHMVFHLRLGDPVDEERLELCKNSRRPK